MIRSTTIRKTILPLLLFSSLCAVSLSQQAQPIIDVHVHAYPADWVKNVLGPLATESQKLPDPPNPITGKRSGAVTNAQLRTAMLAAMRRYNIVKVVASGPLNIVAEWKAADPDRIIGSPLFPLPKLAPYPSIEELREGYASGRLGALGEVTAIYDGLSPSDAKMDEYYTLAEKMDIPEPGSGAGLCSDLRRSRRLRPLAAFHVEFDWQVVAFLPRAPAFPTVRTQATMRAAAELPAARAGGQRP